MTHSKPAQVAVLVTSYNRRALTLASIKSALCQADTTLSVRVVLVDAGSTDGTVEALSGLPGVQVVKEASNIYWNAGMRRAWLLALEEPSDFYMWLNDDLELRSGTLRSMLQLYEKSGSVRTIIVGKTVCPSSSTVSYGGYRRASRWSRIRWKRLEPNESSCDTMNGNCVLIPHQATQDVGVNSAVFRHGFGDIDYGMRAKKRGYDILQLETPVGEQERNIAHVYNGAKINFTWKNVLQVFSDPKGIPFLEWLYFCIRHAGPLWPANFVSRYVKVFRLF